MKMKKFNVNQYEACVMATDKPNRSRTGCEAEGDVFERDRKSSVVGRDMNSDCKLFRGDCLDVLKSIESLSVNLTVTSPPYDSLRAYEGLPFDKFKLVAEELFRVTKPGGVVVWVVGDATVKGSESGTSFRQALFFKKCGFNLHDTMIFHRHNPPLTHKRYEQHFEFMFILSRGPIKTFNPIKEEKLYPDKRKVKSFRRERDGSFDKGHAKPETTLKIKGNVWRYAVGGGHMTQDKINHPAIFPEALARDHIISWSNVCDTVLDPFMGSGTTGKEALKLNRRFIGIELDAEYFAIAKRRIDSCNLQAEFK